MSDYFNIIIHKVCYMNICINLTKRSLTSLHYKSTKILETSFTSAKTALSSLH